MPDIKLDFKWFKTFILIAIPSLYKKYFIRFYRRRMIRISCAGKLKEAKVQHCNCGERTCLVAAFGDIYQTEIWRMKVPVQSVFYVKSKERKTKVEGQFFYPFLAIFHLLLKCWIDHSSSRKRKKNWNLPECVKSCGIITCIMY